MEELASIARGGWAAAVAILAALALAILTARNHRLAKTDEERAALADELREAEAAHRAHLRGGDTVGAIREARRINRLRRRLGLPAAALVLMAALCTACPGCRTAPTRTLVLSEHCRTILPGQTVPDLPAGEPLFWLCTPTGLELMMPADSDLPRLPKEGPK